MSKHRRLKDPTAWPIEVKLLIWCVLMVIVLAGLHATVGPF